MLLLPPAIPPVFIFLQQLGVNNITHSGRTEDIIMEDRFSMPLIITIVCMAASLLLVAAIYGCCHQRLSQRKDQVTDLQHGAENGSHSCRLPLFKPSYIPRPSVLPQSFLLFPFSPFSTMELNGNGNAPVSIYHMLCC